MTTSRVEVVTSVERRRRWSREEKKRLVAATFEPGIRVSDVARAAGVHASQLFRWRKELCERQEPDGSQLVAVAIAPSPKAEPHEAVPAKSSSAAGRRVARTSGLIEIALGDGRCVRVDRDVDGQALRRVLDVLVAR